jgi:ParB family chromosome partitioning protein
MNNAKEGHEMATRKKKRLGMGLSGMLSKPVPVAVDPELSVVASDAGRDAEAVADVESGLTKSPKKGISKKGRSKSGAASHLNEVGLEAGQTSQAGRAKGQSAGVNGRPSVGGVAAANEGHASAASGNVRADGGDGLATIAVASIHPSRHQPRQHMDPVSIASLAESIRTSGLMQPVLVRPADKAGSYELIAGERRWRAAMAAGLNAIPCLVRAVSEQVAAELGVVENLQREDLDAIDKADAFQRLQDEFGLTHQEIGTRVGWTRAAVTNQIRLCELDTDTRGLVQSGALSGGHGRVLLAVDDLKARAGLASKSIRDGWSVREMERQVRGVAGVKAGKRASKAEKGQSTRRAHLDDLEKQLSDHLGTRVCITANKAGYKGRMAIEFYDLDQFDGLLQRVGFTSR